MKLTLIALLLGLYSQLLALDAKEIIQKMNDKYASLKSYSLETQYELFKGSASDVVEEFYTGLIYKSREGFYQKIQQASFVYAPDFFLKVNSDENSMLLTERQDFTLSPVDFSLAARECKEITAEEKDDHYIVSLYFSNVSAVPLSVLRLQIHKKTFLLDRMDLYYSILQDFSKNREIQELEQPHLRVSFSNFDHKPKEKTEYFKLESYLQKQDNKYVPVGMYANYHITDNRKK